MDGFRQPTLAERAEAREWQERMRAKEGDPMLPSTYWDDGLAMRVIRAEIAKGCGACVRVRRVPPAFLRWCLRPWLSFQAPAQAE